MIVREPHSKKPSEWKRPSRVAPLWQARAGKALLQRVTERGGSKFFDEHGRLRSEAGNQFSVAGSDVFRLTAPISDREESDRPYEENVWVRAAIKAIAEGFKRTRFEIYPSAPEGGAEALATHPLLTLLSNPNRVMTEAQFWFAHAVNMKHDGECIWFLMDADGMPVEVDANRNITSMPESALPVRGSLVEVKYDSMGMPMSYRYTTSFSDKSSKNGPEFPCGAVVHFRDYDPYNFTRGLGDVEALERETDLYFQAFRAMDGAVRNGGDPGGFIIYDHEVSADEMERRQAMADEEFAGPNQRRVKLLQSSAKYVPNPVKPSDMQYKELLTWLRDSILSGLGVPPPVVGIYDSATYNNVETAHREMWQGPNGILALAMGAADVITNDLLPRMQRVGAREGEVAWFNASHIEALADDITERLTTAADISAKGIGVSFNEVLEMQGVETEQPSEGDRKWVAATLFDLEDPEAGKREMPDPMGASEGGDGDEDSEGVDEEGAGDESSVDSEDEGTEEARTEPAVAFRNEGLLEPDAKLAKRTLQWHRAYERDQKAQLRRIANGGLRRYSILEEQINPSSLTPEAWDALLLDKTEWAGKLDRAVRVALRDIYAFSLAEAAGEITAPVIDVTHPDVIASLAEQRIQLSEGVTSTTTRRVRNAIAEVLAKVSPPGTLREVIKAALPELNAELTRVFGSKDARSATIAQTETGKAAHNARATQFANSDVDTIQWIASQDEATRASHLAVHGQVIQLGGFFDNGLKYPHDPNGSAGEVINCRCTFIAKTFRDPLDDPDLEIS